MAQTATIKGMKCDGCADTVQKAFADLAGVTAASVDLAAKKATLEGATVTKDQLNAALADTHYEVTDLA
ncbi:heavy-metal-associated domain-containing protein [Loigolactobacillus bifermentans]|uniref:HMA domain-containing protein n=1 Tax=Loigolactobacillus bifermentans DSM 20003 TaxID=1423726 RepID=A0A0R1H9J5_9LACO|nr:heavy metal-associated domain-containing protein [Loigolactobacillus bifermentans]KRK40708.1 hypothetical protein FC07_GL003000 [Loigolactobacillus bifermentans DSM 20003]QGG60938.1 heavy-metal-associated domain-containing protein [Loigolactobacillus bifermentans]